MIKVSLFSNNISKLEIQKYQSKIDEFHTYLHKENQFDAVGWVNYPTEITPEKINELKSQAEKFRSNLDVILVIAIGGSYVGSYAGIEMIKGLFYIQNQTPQIIFVGQSLSANYFHDVLQHVKDKRVGLIVISKSGGTFETSFTFEVIMHLLNNVKQPVSNNKIMIITSDNHNSLHDLAIKNNYNLLFIPENIGGRYSVLTPVGLFVLACSQIDIEKIVNGAQKAYHDLKTPKINQNAAYQYAIYRYFLFRGFSLNITDELLITYEPSLRVFGE
jgi:glucose-6-phosphate isomerase